MSLRVSSPPFRGNDPSELSVSMDSSWLMRLISLLGRDGLGKGKWARGLCGACGRLSTQTRWAAKPALRRSQQPPHARSHLQSHSVEGTHSTRILAPLCCYTPNINGVAYKQQAFFFTALEVRKCKIMLLVDLVSAESPLPGS